MELGGVWTAMIVVQVAVAVAGLPVAIVFTGRALAYGFDTLAPAATSMVRATVIASPSDDASPLAGDPAAFSRNVAELIRRAEADPEVEAVTFSSQFPGMDAYTRIDVEPAIDAPVSALTDSVQPPGWARINSVAIELFDVFDVPMLAGRALVADDASESVNTIVVNAELARRLGGVGDAPGRRIRVAARERDAEPGPWLEIVGVVPDFDEQVTMQNTFDGVAPRFYRATRLDALRRLDLAIRTRGQPERFVQRLRDMAAAIDPTLRLDRMEPATSTWRRGQLAFRGLAILALALAGSVLLLSAAGIHAMMSFTVTRRRREIGIRSALGASARHVLAGVFARAAAQLGAGALVGLGLAVKVDRLTRGGLLNGRALIIVPVVAIGMTTIGVLAALGPARRGLAIEPVEALRAE
jgi:hypothetical protein